MNTTSRAYPANPPVMHEIAPLDVTNMHEFDTEAFCSVFSERSFYISAIASFALCAALLMGAWLAGQDVAAFSVGFVKHWMTL